MKKQIKAQKKVIALRKALLRATTPAQKKAIKTKLAKAKASLKAAKAAVKSITKRIDGKFSKKLSAEITAIRAKLKNAVHPERKAALKAQLRIAKKLIALKKKYAAAPESKKAAIRAKIIANKEKLSLARDYSKEIVRGLDSKKVSAVEAKLAAAKNPKRIAAL